MDCENELAAGFRLLDRAALDARLAEEEAAAR
jgi:hypothetical protein